MRSLGLLLLLALFAASVDAQSPGEPPIRQGFGISFGLGAGSASLTCDDCSDERDTGLSGYLRLGGYVSQTMFVAGETNGWVHSEGGVDEQVSFLSAVVQWYPQPAGSFYLKGGLGLASASADDGFDEVSTTGFGFTLGTGYDWRLTRNFSLTPYLNYLQSVGAEAEVNGIGTDYTLNVNVLQVGLGFTWH